MLNTVSVLTNLSFHAGGSASFCGRPATEACAALVPVLLQRNEEAVIEAARCVGNLSRDGAVRRTMAAQRVDELFIVLLDHACRDVVYTACGALMNVASDEAFKRVRVHAACRRLPAACSRRNEPRDPSDLRAHACMLCIGRLMLTPRTPPHPPPSAMTHRTGPLPARPRCQRQARRHHPQRRDVRP